MNAQYVEPPQSEIPFYAHYQVRFRVIEVLCGTLAPGEVEFDAYVHMGEPTVKVFDTVLVALREEIDGLVEEVNLSRPLFLTTDGRWYGCGEPYAVRTGALRNPVPRAVDFTSPPRFPRRTPGGEGITDTYPRAYFRLEKNAAICIAGVAAVDEWRAIRDGPLTARGFVPAPSSRAVQ